MAVTLTFRYEGSVSIVFDDMPGLPPEKWQVHRVHDRLSFSQEGLPASARTEEALLVLLNKQLDFALADAPFEFFFLMRQASMGELAPPPRPSPRPKSRLRRVWEALWPAR